MVIRTVMHRSFAIDTLVVAPSFWSRPEPSLALHRRYLLVVSRWSPYGHVSSVVRSLKHLRVHVLLRVDIDLFLIRRILKAQLIKTASFIGLRPYRHLRLRSGGPRRRLSSWYVRPMTSGWSGSPFRKSTITSWHHPRYRQITKSRPRPRLRHAPGTNSPPSSRDNGPSETTVPGHVHTEDFLSRRPG